MRGDWRRVPESNRCTRICNPSHDAETITKSGKRTPFVHDEQSKAYEIGVNENPGALAGATGAQNKADWLPAHYTRNRPELATAEWARGIAIGLTRRDRIALAFAALSSLDAEDAEATAEAVIVSAGSPLPPFLTPMDDARFWASLASRWELKAHALACFEAMRPRDRSAFLAHVQGRAAA